MPEESKKRIYDQSSFDAIKPRLNGTKPKYPATPLENGNDAPGRRDAQFENHCIRGFGSGKRAVNTKNIGILVFSPSPKCQKLC